MIAPPPLPVTIRDSLVIAQQFWGGSPPAMCMRAGLDQPTIIFVSQADLDAPLPTDDHVLAPDEHFMARSLTPGCQIELPYTVSLNTPEERVDECDGLTHEDGHSRGELHSANPKSIMFWQNGRAVVGACFRRFWKASRAAWIALRGPLVWASR